MERVVIVRADFVSTPARLLKIPHQTPDFRALFFDGGGDCFSRQCSLHHMSSRFCARFAPLFCRSQHFAGPDFSWHEFGSCSSLIARMTALQLELPIRRPASSGKLRREPIRHGATKLRMKPMPNASTNWSMSIDSFSILLCNCPSIRELSSGSPRPHPDRPARSLFENLIPFSSSPQLNLPSSWPPPSLPPNRRSSATSR
jgi:hypothetical protein